MQTRRCAGSAVAACLAVIAAVLFSLPANARSEADPAMVRSHLGSYLAGRVARRGNDIASAAKFYDRALKSDPNNRSLVYSAFLMAAADGNFERAVVLAKALSGDLKRRQLSNLWVGVDAFRKGDYKYAEKAFRAVRQDAISRLVAQLALAWTAQAQGRTTTAVRRLQTRDRQAWAQFFAAYRFYATYHRALIADMAGRSELADASFKAVIARDPRATRAPLAFARALATRGQSMRAVGVLNQYHQRTGELHPVTARLLSDIGEGKVKTRLISTPTEGLAEAFYGLGEALVAQNAGDLLGPLFLQVALELRKPSPSALVALANLYERQQRFGRANTIYDRLPEGSPLYGAVQIRKALNLNSLDRVEEARRVLLAKVAQDPSDLNALRTLGNIMRARKRYPDAVDAYSKAIALIKSSDQQDWTIWYGRGASYERLKKWELAEQDLLKAKELAPNEPLILNYLGYSWVDQGRNLTEGLELIKKAVALKPKDGYITDSLGWAYFRLGDYQRAVRHLEEAVRLQPEDPILNDHLGDALWKVGRHREARFQWELALSFKPEPDEATKIKQKLAKRRLLDDTNFRNRTGLAPAEKALQAADVEKSQAKP